MTGIGRAAQAQARHLLFHRPQLLAVVGIEAVQSAVDRAHHHHLLADRRRGQQFGVHPRAPQLLARSPRRARSPTFARTDHHQPQGRAGPAENGNLSFLTHTWWPVSRLTATSSPLSRRREHQAVVDRRSQAQAQLDLFLAAADLVAPQLFHRKRGGKLTSFAGGSTSLSLLQPARSAARRRPTEVLSASGFSLVRRVRRRRSRWRRITPGRRSRPPAREATRDRQFSRVNSGIHAAAFAARRARPCIPPPPLKSFLA
jgi:hypothetical protein